MTDNDTRNALDGTLGALRGGVVRLGIAAAVPEISAWEERLAASDEPGLRAIAENLSELRRQLEPGGFDPVTAGALLTSLGDQVEQVAGDEVAGPVRAELSQLGKLLGEEGASITDGLTKT